MLSEFDCQFECPVSVAEFTGKYFYHHHGWSKVTATQTCWSTEYCNSVYVHHVNPHTGKLFSPCPYSYQWIYNNSDKLIDEHEYKKQHRRQIYEIIGEFITEAEIPKSVVKRIESTDETYTIVMDYS